MTVSRGGGNGKSQRRKSRCRHFESASHHLIRIFFSLDRSHEVVTLTVSPFLSHRLLTTWDYVILSDTCKITLFKMAARDLSGAEEIMRSTWSWACRPRDRCPRSATYTPGYPAVEEGPSLLGGLPRRPPVVPDGNNHRAHPSAGNQMSCHAVRPFRYRRKKSARLLSFLERGAIGRSMISSARADEMI